MAKRKISLTYTNAEIDNEEYLIIETTKDEVKVYDMKELVDKLANASDVRIAISYDEEIEPQNTEY